MPAAGVSLSEVSVTPASVTHGLPAINVCFGMAPRVYCLCGQAGVGVPFSGCLLFCHLLPFLLFLPLVPPPPFPSPAVSQRSPEGSVLVARVETCSETPTLLAVFPSPTHFPTPFMGLPGISFEMNYLLPNPCLRVCFRGIYA